MTSVYATELVDLDFIATDKVSAISSLAERIVESGRGTDANQITLDVIARDELGTPQFNGVAIPHARSTGVSSACVAVARSSTGIVFDPMEPAADLIFMIVVPSDAGDQHLEILAQLARRILDSEFTAAVRALESAEEIVDLLNKGEEKP